MVSMRDRPSEDQGRLPSDGRLINTQGQGRNDHTLGNETAECRWRMLLSFTPLRPCHRPSHRPCRLAVPDDSR